MSHQVPPTIKVSQRDLPITCPFKGAKWNLHPRVYLPVPAGERSVSCPYCGTKYEIVAETQTTAKS